MHSNCQEEVFFAGEFHVRKNGVQCQDITYTLVLDNNSGSIQWIKFFCNFQFFYYRMHFEVEWTHTFYA
jgi:hypothetical protein